MNMSKNIIKYLFDVGSLDEEEMLQLVENGNITENQYHQITRYNYEGMKRGSRSKNPLDQSKDA